jgi:probable O-glycosylation ligase (exosortase A-associated)
VRDIVLVLATFCYLPMTLMSPAAGIACWVWFSVMSPHEQIYSFARGKPFNGVIAVATLLALLFSNDRKRWPADVLPWLVLLFTLWMTFNSFFVPFPDWSWPYWDRTMRIMVLIFVVFAIVTRKARIHGLIWSIVISLGFYGVKGGVFTIMTGGNYVVYGPPSTILSDNNQLAAAVVMGLPLVNYLRMHTKNLPVRIGLTVAIGLEVVMVLGSHSRGGVIALAVSLILFWLTMRRKVIYGVAGAAIVGVALLLMPPEFWSRMSTVQDATADASFQGRLMAWHVATAVATDRFPFGAGFYAPQLPAIWDRYSPDTTFHAAHSIYFQVLGEHGFIGLGIYVLILLLALRNVGVILRRAANRPELLWAYDLAKMMRVSLIGFYVGGAALSMAYFDALFVLIALSSTLRELVVTATNPAKVAEPRRFGRSQVLPDLPGAGSLQSAGAPGTPWRTLRKR